MTAKFFANNKDNAVDEALAGFCASHPHLGHIVADKNDVDKVKQERVTLISGGGAGHEPAHAGYVGKGMLTCAISGNIFASPSSRQILAALQLATSTHGTLMIVKNYTGDVLNFNLAKEKARAKGLSVEIVVVGDDVAVGRKRGGVVGRRGLAGTVLVHKIAGAAAERGMPLNEVKDIALSVASNLATVGIALESVHVPGTDITSEHRIPSDQVEIGLGIHGEPGFERAPMRSCRELIARGMKMILASKDQDPDRGFIEWAAKDRVVVLVNNLGGTSHLEMGIVSNDVSYVCAQHSITIERMYCDSYMTSLQTKGVSITLLRLEDHANLWLSLLDDVSEAPGWHIGRRILEAKAAADVAFIGSLKNDETRENVMPACDDTLSLRVKAVCASMILAERELNELDSIMGDGDCGTTLRRGAQEILDGLNTGRIRTKQGYKIFLMDLADAVERGMGGTIFLNAMAADFDENQSQASWTTAWRHAFSAGLNRLMEATPARPGHRTLMDALVPFVHTFQHGSIEESVQAARAGCNLTIGMPAKLGRASYVGSEAVAAAALQPDAGARGVMILLESILNQLST